MGKKNSKEKQPVIVKRKKIISFAVGDIKEHLEYMQSYMWLLAINCILCKIKINIGDLSFPPTEEDFDALEAQLKSLEADESEDEDNEKMHQKYERDMEHFFITEPLKTIRSLDIKNKDSFESMASFCFFLSDALTLHSYYPNIVTAKTASYFMLYSNVAIGKVYELIGYWTAKMEKRGNNPGAEAMKKRGERNAKAIKDIVANLKINNTGIFRKDKRLREQFFSLAKEMTDCTSEDRLLKIARSLCG